jgi:outer membrane protein assembly factor BamD
MSSCKFNKIRKSGLKEKFDAAIDYYDKADYYKAGLLLEDVIPLIIGTQESEKAQFYFAYCNYHQSQLVEAAYYFQRFYQTFRLSKFAEEARYMQVRSLYEDSPPFNLDQSSTVEAISVTQSFLNAYPNSAYFEECSVVMNQLREKLEKKSFENAKLYHKIGNYLSSVIAFKNFQRDFPDSDFNEEGSYLRLDAQYKYAEQSTARRKRERYDEAITHYEYILDNYPESKFLKAARKIYEKCLNELGKLNS